MSAYAHWAIVERQRQSQLKSILSGNSLFIINKL
jgi:hypothetical protein